MLYQLNISITEDDYLAYNYFQAFESVHGKKLVRKSRLSFVLAMVVVAALFILVNGFTAFSVTYVIVLVLFTALYMAFFRKMMMRNIKKQITRLKKSGKLPYDPEAAIEFYQDYLVENTASHRTEHRYDALERICILGDRYIFLCYSSVGAYILPFPQLRTQLDPNKLLGFLTQKCGTVEHY